MRSILIIAPPILKDKGDKSSFLTIPPDGYGGVENVIFALINGLLHYGLQVTLIGAPGSRSIEGLKIVRNARTPEEIRNWVTRNHDLFDVVHDHGCGVVFNKSSPIDENIPYIATHHQTGYSPYSRNSVYLSFAQRAQAMDIDSPVVRIPVIMDDYIFCADKDDYFLYLGRVSEWKGVYETVSLCGKLNKKLIIAGPAWEEGYFEKINRDFKNKFEYVGNVSGLKRLDLISRAKALIILSRSTASPWGGEWCEPGSTVVSEACASGTPVISSTNGCLSELVVPEIGFQLTEKEIDRLDISKLDGLMPDSKTVYEFAKKNWDHLNITKSYLQLYKELK